MTSPRWIPITLAGACVLTACSTAGEEPAPARTSAQAAPTAPTAPAASPSPTGLSPAAYDAELKSAMGPVGSSFKSLAKSKSIGSLDDRLERAEGALADAVDRLGDIDPPPEAAAEHADYVEALRDVHSRVGDMRDGVAGQALCSSSAVLASMGRSDVFRGLKTAAADLSSRGDFTAETINVKVPKQRDRRLRNGTLIRNGGRGGRAYLEINNGGSKDAVVTLVRGKSKVLSVYIRKKKKFRINSMRDATYKVYYTTGKDWDRSARAFSRDCDFKRFEKSIRFRTTRSGSVIRWTNWTLSLHAVIGGTARTKRVKPSDFPR